MFIADQFTQECRDHFGSSLEKYIVQIEEMAARSVGLAAEFSATNDVSWSDQHQADLQTIHNRWVNILFSAYCRKNATYLNALINALNRFDYLSYAMSARSLIETAATLRYYVFNKYEPLILSESVDLEAVIAIHEGHFHGKRFDWGDFSEGDIESLRENWRLPGQYHDIHREATAHRDLELPCNGRR